MRARLQFLAALAFGGLSLGAAGYGYHLVGQARLEIVALARQRRALEAQIRQNQEKLAAEAQARPAPEGSAAAGAAKGATSPGPQAAPAREPTLNELLAADPKLFDLHLRSFRADMHESYSALYHTLGLSPAQIEKVETLATAQEADQRDLAASAESQGLPQDDPGIAAMRQQMKQQFRADLVAQLGFSAKTVNEAQHQQQTIYAPMQNAVDSIGFAASWSQAPLDQGQAAQLAQVMASSTPQYQAGKAAAPKSIDWNSVLAQAPSFLNSAQIEAIQQQAAAQAIQKMANEYVAQRTPPPQP